MTKGKQTYFNILARNKSEVDIYLYGEITRWSERSGKGFLNQIKDLERKGFQKVNLHIHSEGGEVFEGWAIVNAILNSSMEFTAIVDGIAASIAFIIFIACKKRKMTKSSLIMLHQASGYAHGNSEDLQSAADLLEKADDLLYDAIKEASGKSEEEIAKWRNGKDHWFKPDEALKEGIIDEVLNTSIDTPDLPENYKDWSPSNAFEHYTHLENKFYSQNENQMDKGYLIKACGLNITASSSDKEVETAISNAMQSRQELIANQQAALSDKDKEIEELENQVAESEVSKITALIDSAVNQKKITAKQRASFEKIAETSSFESVKAILDGMKSHKSIKDIIEDGAEDDENKPKPVGLQGKIAMKMAAKQKK